MEIGNESDENPYCKFISRDAYKFYEVYLQRRGIDADKIYGILTESIEVMFQTEKKDLKEFNIMKGHLTVDLKCIKLYKIYTRYFSLFLDL